MTILLDLIIVHIGNVIIADMNGKFPYTKEQKGINVQDVTNNRLKALKCVKRRIFLDGETKNIYVEFLEKNAR